jgi:hypothetical protein
VKTTAHVGHGGGAWVVETEELRPFIESWLSRQQVEHEAEFKPGGRGNIHAGPIGNIAATLSHYTGQTVEAMTRRLYAIRSGESATVNAELAEFVLFSIDEDLSSADLPQFPSGLTAAKDAAEVWAEDWSELERAQLAQMLYKFVRGYFSVQILEASDEWALMECAA